MSRKFRSGLRGYGGYEVLDSLFPLIQAAEWTNSIGMSMTLIEQQLLVQSQWLRDVDRQRDALNDVWRDLVEAAKRMPGPPTWPPLAYSHRPLGIEVGLLELTQFSQDTYFNFGLAVKTLQDLSINISSVERAIEESLRVFRDIDWSTMLEPEDLAELDLDAVIDDPVIDLNDHISFQQWIAGLFHDFRIKNPVVACLLLFLVYSPIQTAYDEAVLNLVRGGAEAVVEQTVSKDYRVIEKTIKIEVNNTLNTSIESREIKDEILKRYGYVATDRLIMRKRDCVDSRALHTLGFGQVVKIVHKKRNWTLVEYEGDEGLIRGWVFTRYISNFKK